MRQIKTRCFAIACATITLAARPALAQQAPDDPPKILWSNRFTSNATARPTAFFRFTPTCPAGKTFLVSGVAVDVGKGLGGGAAVGGWWVKLTFKDASAGIPVQVSFGSAGEGTKTFMMPGESQLVDTVIFGRQGSYNAWVYVGLVGRCTTPIPYTVTAL